MLTVPPVDEVLELGQVAVVTYPPRKRLMLSAPYSTTQDTIDGLGFVRTTATPEGSNVTLLYPYMFPVIQINALSDEVKNGPVIELLALDDVAIVNVAELAICIGALKYHTTAPVTFVIFQADCLCEVFNVPDDIFPDGILMLPFVSNVVVGDTNWPLIAIHPSTRVNENAPADIVNCVELVFRVADMAVVPGFGNEIVAL